MVDIKYSQNFYINEDNLERIISKISISSNNIVLDIGAGYGNITKVLSKYSNRVIAYELDKEYFGILKKNLSEYSNISFLNEDFLESQLPKEIYKVFSNIPFSLTSDIINKITNIKSNLEDAYLFVQKESADRYMGIPKNTQVSSILSYIYNFTVVEQLYRGDFKPWPDVDIVILRIERKEVDMKEFELYRDFVTYIFNQMNRNVIDSFKRLFTFKQLGYIQKEVTKNKYIKPTDIPSSYYLEIYKYFKKNGLDYLNRVKGSYLKHLNMHLEREKVNRTRV